MLISIQNRRAQSLIEFMLLVTLVAAAVIIMGPYVIRSWNANMKMWDDSVQDSFTDPIGNVPPTGLEVPECNCQYVAPCDDEPCCGVESCGPLQRSLIWLCDPLNCAVEPNPPVDAFGNPVNKCENHLLCCTDWKKRDVPSQCGEAGCPETRVPADRTCLPGSPLPTFQCMNDENCQNQCEDGIPAPTGATIRGICKNDDVGLITPANWVTVPEGGCSVPEGSSPKCQVECQSPAVPDATGTGCVCNVMLGPGSGTWTVPEGVNQIVLTLVAGGGGGGAGLNDGAGGGGGGGGYYERQLVSGLIPGTAIPYVIGARGNRHYQCHGTFISGQTHGEDSLFGAADGSSGFPQFALQGGRAGENQCTSSCSCGFGGAGGSPNGGPGGKGNCGFGGYGGESLSGLRTASTPQNQPGEDGENYGPGTGGAASGRNCHVYNNGPCCPAGYGADGMAIIDLCDLTP